MVEELQSKLISNKQLKLIKDKTKTFARKLLLSKDRWIYDEGHKCWTIKYNYDENISKLNNVTMFISDGFWISSIDDKNISICSERKIYNNKYVWIYGEYKWT